MIKCIVKNNVKNNVKNMVVFKNNPIDLVLDEYYRISNNIRPVEIIFDKYLQIEGLNGQVIFHEDNTITIRISVISNIMEVGIILAHELAHILDFRNKVGIVIDRNNIHDSHDSIWENYFERLKTPLRLKEMGVNL
jgi:hypothetical protein